MHKKFVILGICSLLATRERGVGIGGGQLPAVVAALVMVAVVVRRTRQEW